MNQNLIDFNCSSLYFDNSPNNNNSLYYYPSINPNYRNNFYNNNQDCNMLSNGSYYPEQSFTFNYLLQQQQQQYEQNKQNQQNLNQINNNNANIPSFFSSNINQNANCFIPNQQRNLYHAVASVRTPISNQAEMPSFFNVNLNSVTANSNGIQFRVPLPPQMNLEQLISPSNINLQQMSHMQLRQQQQPQPQQQHMQESHSQMYQQIPNSIFINNNMMHVQNTSTNHANQSILYQRYQNENQYPPSCSQSNFQIPTTFNQNQEQQISSDNESVKENFVTKIEGIEEISKNLENCGDTKCSTKYIADGGYIVEEPESDTE